MTVILVFKSILTDKVTICEKQFATREGILIEVERILMKVAGIGHKLDSVTVDGKECLRRLADDTVEITI